MKISLDILYEIGQTCGSTRKIYHTLANLVAATIENLEQSRNSINIKEHSSSSPTQILILPPAQLPMRIDASLQLDRTSHGNVAQSPTPYPSIDCHRVLAIQTSEPHTITHLPREGPVNQLNPPVSEHQSRCSTTPSVNVTNQEPVRASLSEVLDESLFWDPSLEWTGSWDDFLNAIAM